MQFEKRYTMKKRFLIFIFIGLLLGACGYVVPQNYSSMNRLYVYPQSGNYSSNSEQIYSTAKSKMGNAFPIRAVPVLVA